MGGFRFSIEIASICVPRDHLNPINFHLSLLARLRLGVLAWIRRLKIAQRSEMIELKKKIFKSDVLSAGVPARNRTSKAGRRGLVLWLLINPEIDFSSHWWNLSSSMMENFATVVQLDEQVCDSSVSALWLKIFPRMLVKTQKSKHKAVLCGKWQHLVSVQ